MASDSLRGSSTDVVWRGCRQLHCIWIFFFPVGRKFTPSKAGNASLAGRVKTHFAVLIIYKCFRKWLSWLLATRQKT